jgi:hypothetical protein
VHNNHFVPVFEHLPHQQAPMFDHDSNPAEVVRQVVSDIQSGNYPTAERYREVYRQAALVSLFFFTKLVMGFDGPYDELNYTLHVDMCNFVQRQIRPGRKAAGFLFRSGLKTTIGSKAKMAWRLTRNPNLRIGIGSSIVDRAQEFRDAVKNLYDNNELFHWLFPEKKPAELQPRWTQKDMVVPDRTMNLPEPSIKVFAIGGSTAGIHVDDLNLDDIVDDSQLDSGRLSSADMVRTANWLQANIPSLVISWLQSTVMLWGTRYAADDPYEWILEDVAAKYGYWEGMDYPLNPEGEWHIYYRQGLEFGDVAYPARLTKKGLAKMLETNPWTYWFQYINNVQKGGNSEFGDYAVGRCFVDWRPELDDWVVTLVEPHRKTQREYLLSNCDVVQAVDPAGSETRTSSRTSRSAHGVIVTTPDYKRIVIDGHCDYVAATTTLFDWMFEAFERYSFIRVTALEVQGPFKVLRAAIDQAQQLRQQWINVSPVTAPGNKDARIRSVVQPLLHQGNLYCVDSVRDVLMGEIKSFPNGHKKDFLDMLSIGIKAGIVPPTIEEIEQDRDDLEIAAVGALGPGTGGRNKHTGY